MGNVFGCHESESGMRGIPARRTPGPNARPYRTSAHVQNHRHDYEHAQERHICIRENLNPAHRQMPERTAIQRATDDANIQGLPIHPLTRSGGRNLLVHDICTCLSARDMAGALGACHAFHSMMPEAVRTLDGFRGRTRRRGATTKVNDAWVVVRSLKPGAWYGSASPWPPDPPVPVVNDNMIIELVQRFQHLTCIDLRGCTRLTGAVLIAIAENCPNLASLDIRGCKMGDEAITAVVDKCPNLLPNGLLHGHESYIPSSKYSLR
mmetsp:Transcript_16462/g.34382  ORF Transcript_16462/g.34382 Transcript_16462/m.34382 type:complete len:265 (-) Transcript_16462:212-1006(-)